MIETTDHAEDSGEYSYSGAAVLNQFAYGTMYIDEPLVYDRNLDASVDDYCVEAGDARYFYHQPLTRRVARWSIGRLATSELRSHRRVKGQDANFRVVMLTDEDGDVVERTRYTAYGEPTLFGGENASGDELHNATLVSSVGNPFMHQGLFRDRETRSYHNRYRQYNSKNGRFMQRDPLGYVDGMNLYEYVTSTPARGFDPSGLNLNNCSRARGAC